MTEGGIRVPFIASWPGKIPEGKISNEIIAFQDMMPTFADIAGAKVAEKIDGISVVDALLGRKQTQQHKYLYWDYGHCRNRYDQAVRIGKWKGIRLGQGGKIQLYNLENDIGEKNDLADTYPQIVHEIESIMKTAYTLTNDILLEKNIMAVRFGKVNNQKLLNMETINKRINEEPNHGIVLSLLIVLFPYLL